MQPANRRLPPVPATLLLLAALLGLTACAGGFADAPPTLVSSTQPTASTDAPAPAGADAGPAEAAAPTGEPAPTIEPPTPTPADPFPGEGPWPVTFKAADGVNLAGMVYGKGDTAFVLVPMYPGEPVAWEGFANQAAAEGFRALAFDLRGHGESAGEADFTAAPDDIAGALAYLREHGVESIVLVGAGMSTIPAIQAAGEEGAVDGLALLSALREDGGVELTNADLEALAVPTLWLAARVDMTHNTEEMAERAASPVKDVWIYEGTSLRGTYLFEGADAADVTRRLLEFAASVAGG